MNFEFNIEGIVEAARACSAKRIALQFPEGLMEYSCRLSEEVRDNCHKAGLTSVEEVVILGEAIFGACCIDDTLSKLLRVELIVHFGHSRVVSRAITDSDGVTAMYIPVIAKESSWSPEDGCAKIMEHFGPADRLALESTAQFLKGAVKIAEQLKANGRSVICPKIGDLAPGETLGCTSPTLKDIDAIV